MALAAAMGNPCSVSTDTFAVAVGAAAVQVGGVNQFRAGMVIYNSGAASALVRYGANCSAANYHDVIPAASRWVMPIQYQGIVTLFCATSTTVNVGELS